MNKNCRNRIYPGSNGKVNRFPVPDEKVSWEEPYPDYRPPTYTVPGILGQPWADPEIGTEGFSPKWNSKDVRFNRHCGCQKYTIDSNGYPINPVGRTGLKGRGRLGKWAVNCAGDAVVTRWKMAPDGENKVLDDVTKKPYLQFVAIKRKDCGEWAIPGGFAEDNEDPEDTARREFMEEALDSGSKKFTENKEEMLKKVDKLFANRQVVYSGYVDDQRNTDQAWISTTAVNFHDETGCALNDVDLSAGDDAGAVQWVDIDSSIKLYASHKDIIEATAKKLNAHF